MTEAAKKPAAKPAGVQLVMLTSTIGIKKHAKVTVDKKTADHLLANGHARKA